MAQTEPSKTVVPPERLKALEARSDSEHLRSLRRTTRRWEFVGVGALLAWFIVKGAAPWLLAIGAFVAGVPIAIWEAISWSQAKELEDRAVRLEAVDDPPSEMPSNSA